MSRRPEFRFVLVDLAILVALLVIAWAVYSLARVEPQMLRERQQAAALQQVFREAQQLFKQNTNDWEVSRRELDLSWYDTLLLKTEYFFVAERIASSLPALQATLSSVAEGRLWTPGGLTDLQNWIDKESERVTLERLEQKSKDLQARIAQSRLDNTNSVAVPTNDLGTLMGDIARTYRSYRAELEAAAENAGKPLVGAVVAQHVERGRQDVLRLSRLAGQAQKDGAAIEEFLKLQTGVENRQQRQRQDQLIQTLSEAESPAQLVRQLETRTEAGNHPFLLPRDIMSLRRARYLLVVALAGLGIFLVLDLYSRLVVVPLRLKLMERDRQIEHQKKLAHFEELAAELAHEIRNPLTAISALLYTVQRKLQAGTSEHKDATVIRNELDRVNQILKEFIQMTRPAPPKLELMSAGPLLKEVSDLMSPELERNAVRLEQQTPGHARFYGDQQQLKQVLINLIQNAAESFEQQGPRKTDGAVVLRARDETIPFNGTPANVAIIEVEDNGPGIRPEVRARLFEPFFSTKKTGTGLGLPISARIIDRHGGRLDVETQPGQGTTFRIVLLAHEQRN